MARDTLSRCPAACPSPAEAEAAIRQHATQLPAVHLPLTELSGAVLRESITSTRDQPPFDRVTMDGIAFSFASWETGRNSFRIAGTQAAGAAPLTLREPTDCIEVMTGAMLPIGCDCVVPVENIEVGDGIAQLRDDAPAPVRNFNIHNRGIDSRRGDLLLPSGCRLGPAEVAVIASNGQTHALVARPPRIVVISTGDELVEPGQPLQDWQISRSNVYAVLASLRQHGLFRALARSRAGRPAQASRASALSPRSQRRADPERRRLDGPVRLRSAGVCRNSACA